MPDVPDGPPHRRWWRQFPRPGLRTILAALPLVIIASAAASAGWFSGGPSPVKVRGAGAAPARVPVRTERSIAPATPVRQGHGGPTIADATATPHGYWLAGILARRPAAKPATPVAAQHQILAAVTRRAHPAVAPAAKPAHPAAPAATTSTLGTPLGPFEVTCYDLQGITASGAPVGPGTVAVDPSVIPLGSHIYVQGVGALTARDTGGAIIGRHIDLWEPSYSQCVNWGVESRAVWLEG